MFGEKRLEKKFYSRLLWGVPAHQHPNSQAGGLWAQLQVEREEA